MIRFSHEANSWQASHKYGDKYDTLSPYMDITVDEARYYFDKGYPVIL